MAVIADRLDSVALELLDVLTELQSRRRDAHNILANGHLSLSQARYSMGVKSVSALQFPSEMTASATIALQTEDSGMKVQLHTETIKSAKFTTEPREEDTSSVHGTQLRHRKVGAKEAAIEKTSVDDMDILIEDKKTPTQLTCSDPLSWFGILVPQSLRSAKKTFSEAVEMIVQVTNLQMKLEQLRTEYRQLLKEKEKATEGQTLEEMSSTKS